MDEGLRPRGGCGYVDLILAHAEGGETAMAATAALLGYGPARRRPTAPSPAPSLPVVEAKPEPSGEKKPEPKTPFWHLVRHDFRQPLAEEAPTARVSVEKKKFTLAKQQPPTPELSRWSALIPRLRCHFTERAAGRQPDIDALIRHIGRGRALRRLPRRTRRRWGVGVQVIIDRSERLIPFQEDQDRLAVRLAALFPAHAGAFALHFDGLDEPVSLAADGDFQDYRLPLPGSLVVVLGDLGCLAGDARRLMRHWQRLGRRLAAAGCRPVALTPCPESRWSPGALSEWSLLAWERRSKTVPPTALELERRAERLLRLLSPAVRIEPGLLRTVRLLLGAAADAGTEADVWSHRAMIGRSRVAGTLDPEEGRRLRAELRQEEPLRLRVKTIERLHRWRGGLADEVWAEELLNLPADLRPHLPASIRNQDLPTAVATLKKLAVQQAQRPAISAWYRRLYDRVSPEDYHRQADPELRRAQQRLYVEAFKTVSDRPSPPPGFDPALSPPTHDQPVSIELRQRGHRLLAGPGSAGSPLATLTMSNDLLAIGPPPQRPEGFWPSGQPPTWAEDWDWDEYGPWVIFSIDGVSQRMRWIPPGRFRMGSPEDEPGRFDDEGPQHEVTISQGFWLFDTPCTQALWQAVMGENPSHFQSPDRPVENMSWKDVYSFLSRINAQLPGLELELPSDAQWEYACRAGSGTALYSGDIEILGERNAPALDAIAWYGGNSGVGFELENGHDSSGWPEKQYPHEKAGTRPVALKRANAWGLYDMLGNVWEWCVDGQRNYGPETLEDPRGPTGDGVRRVVRGGSWSDVARYARSAFRGWRPPDDRLGHLGFRCSRVPVSRAGQAGAPLVIPASVRPAERAAAPGSSSGAGVLLTMDQGRESACPLPSRPVFQVESDRERLTFQRLTRPAWAAAMGRDGFGLWAEIEVGGVRQRLRWISPGRFRMGSPMDEPGRFDKEGPQHEVTISKGYWLFDTPCTQALWQTVMGGNPSEFQSPNRPVETVSFEEVQRFLTRINEQAPGLDLGLPTEAQWEYACRAGSATAFYTGGIEILGKHNAPVLDAIAWYGGNSGHEFDLETGWDSSDWPEKQYPHETAGTRPVRLKRANAWGLHDMLGNVYEWCADGRRGYDAEAAIDPEGATGDGVKRVVRGGSWVGSARGARSAARDWLPPDDRFDALGFRCSRVHP